MQGLKLPNPRPCLSSSLPPVMELPSSPPLPPVEPFEFHEPVDTYGQAQVCSRVNNNRAISTTVTTSFMPPPGPTSLPSTTNTPMPLATPMPAAATGVTITTTLVPEVATSVAITTTALSQTSLWQKRKKLEALKQQSSQDGSPLPASKRPRKPYSCKIYGLPRAGNFNVMYFNLIKFM